MDALGMTSRWVAASRARESSRADALFNDPFAGALAGDEGRAMLASIEAASRSPSAPPDAPADNPYLAIRTRYFDDLLLDAARAGTTQIAILAAGMDARAFRLAWPPGVTVFEVEREPVLAHKERVLAELGAKPTTTRVAVACDLRNDFGAALRAAGYSDTKPAMILVEGLLPYLPDEDAVLSLLRRIAAIAAPGSTIAFDTPSATMLTSEWTKALVAVLAAHGVPWLFGTDDPEGLVVRAGFHGAHAVEPGTVGHGRWPYPTAPRAVPGVPRTFLMTARR